MIARLLQQRECTGGASKRIERLINMRQRQKRKVLQAWKRWKDVKEINAMIETGHVWFRFQDGSGA